MKGNLFNIIFILLFLKLNCHSKKKDELTSCDKEDDSKNKFILKTDLSQNELEELLSKNFSSLTNHNKKPNRNQRYKRDINKNVKEFKSKDNNKTILLLEVGNITEIIDDDKSNKEIPYELIDENEHNETKIFLSFDKFFSTQYKEMFEYSYTIVIFILILIILVIYYIFILPNEAPDWNINSTVATNNSRKNQNINIENEYILKDNDI